MDKINILYVITKLELGGAQKHLLDLVKNLNRQRYRIFLFTAQDGLLIKDAEFIGDLTLIKSRYLERPISPLKDILAFLELYFFIKKIQPQIVHTHSSKAGILGRLAAKLAGINIIIHTVHGWPFHNYQFRLIFWLFVWLERIAAIFTTKLIVVSYHDRLKGIRYKIGDSHRYEVISYGIEYVNFKKEKNLDLKKQLGIDLEKLVVGMIACFKPQKAIFDFLKLAQKISHDFKETIFILVGDGLLRPKIEEFIDRVNLKDKVILLGWRRDIADILSIIDIFVLTSLWEGLPISVLEAMASGKPVVVTNTGGISEVIKDYFNGFLVNCGDIEMICQKILILLKDEKLRKEIGEKARRSLVSDDRFSLSYMIKRTELLYYKAYD